MIKKTINIFRLWLPPALSNIILATEIPIIIAFVARGPKAMESIAAFGVALSLIIVVNSPALALTSTTAAIGHTLKAFHRMRLFSLAIGLGSAILLSIVLLTPVSRWLLVTLMGLAEPLVPIAELGLWLFVPVPLAVSCRRCHQGLLIYLQDTAAIAYASGVHVVISVFVALLVLNITAWPGIVIGGLAFTTGTVGEALVLTAWSLKRLSILPPGNEPLSFIAMLRFHLPLAGTALLALLYVPLIIAVIARSRFPVLSLAAWPVLYGLLSLIASPSLEIEAITISFATSAEGKRVTRIFCGVLGLILSTLLLAIVITPLSSLYFFTLSGLTSRATILAIQSSYFALIIPFLYTLRDWLRGLLITNHRPDKVQLAVGSSFVALFGALSAGQQILRSLPGLYVGTLSLNLALVVEVTLLWRFSLRLKKV